ncbi:hypothetical protein CDO52_16795 [Nocardiopsis gilva YIM 90087]|uniref:Uncharacterized protein n=1 Tax=Nocardiopsis gilva YIM 90087 TaxID=1235441 RepID=A0A223S7Y5_9ACTN|nr:hypothetical protein [Nocardiopsis gilva]ASU84230.1 hypothetical protein CDO52_16795 [Nocardiopsis gilva YIM 90087]
MGQGSNQARGTAPTSPDGVARATRRARYAGYAAVAWSVIYTGLAAYWAVTGHGFPYASDAASDVTGPLVGRFGPDVAWGAVVVVGAPAAVLGAVMLRGVRTARPVLITLGALVSVQLLLLMTTVDLLALVGYTPYALVSLVTKPEVAAAYARTAAEAGVLHQLFCLVGGFLWALATLAYARRSSGACPRCGRLEGAEGWRSPASAARWGRVAVYLAIVPPVVYALTRFAWALGLPLGISEEFLREGQELGMWTTGVFLASFGLVGAVLTLGLIQRWGEVFPRWMVRLAGRRVPVALAVVPASIVAVLLAVGGVAMWSGYAEMVGEAVSGSDEGMGLLAVLPTALFPLWGVALGVATLAYYYRRRGACSVCGRGETVRVSAGEYAA